MANQEHIALIQKGIDNWNSWRIQNSELLPDLFGANLFRAELREADLSDTDLRGANLREADLSGADLSFANGISASLTEAKLVGAKLFRADLRGANFSGADLSFANLFGANLFEAKFFDAKLLKAHLREADLAGANFLDSDLSGADLSGADLSGANLFGANLSEANLSGADLGRTTLIDANLTNATLKDCSIYGISAWDVQLDGAERLNLIITPKSQPTITVDNLKVAHFVYLLLNNQELRDVLNTVMERGVLLLGRFGGGGLDELKAIAEKLRDNQYLPMIFDFKRPDNRDFTETVMTLAGLSRFVIADLSGPSVPNELRATVPHIKIPFAPIIEEGREVYSMFSDLLGFPWVLAPIEFRSKEHLLEILFSKVIQPAEEKFKERQEKLNQIFDRNP